MLQLSSWPVIVGAFAITFASGFFTGNRIESNARDAKELRAERDWKAKTEALALKERNATRALLALNTAADTELRTLHQRIKDAKRETSPAAAPEWVVTDDDQRLWNAALCAGVDTAACRAAAASVRSAPAPPGGDAARPVGEPR